MRTRWRPLSLFGPLFTYDLVASTRRGQHTGLRILVASLLLFVLYIVYAFNIHGYDPLTDPFAPGPTIAPKDMADLAGKFAAWCLIVQLGAVILLTPTVVADAIARDKERRALDFLFVTDLTDREIVLGKLGSRMAYLVGVILTGLPILAITQLFGGVAPALLFTGYAALFATLLSIGALSMYCSVVSSTALQATVRAYAATAGFLLLCPFVFIRFVPMMDWVGIVFYVVANLLIAGVLVLASVANLRPRAASLGPPPPPPPRPRRARRPPPAVAVVEAIQTEAVPTVLAVEPTPDRGWDPVEWRNLDRPIVWEPPERLRMDLQPVDEQRPLLWKEVHLHSFTIWTAGGSVIQVMLGSAAGLILLLIRLLWILATGADSIGEVVAVNNGVVKVGTIVLSGLFGFGVMMHAVNSVTREREKDTLDSLLTLPVNREAILEAKWLGGLVSLRLEALGMVGVWLFGVATGALHPLALVVLALSVAAVVEFLASMGLFLSVVSTTSLRANMAAALCLLLVACGPWIVANYIELLSPYGRQSPTAEATTAALMPPIAWVKLCIPWGGYAKLPEGYFRPFLGGALAYAVAAWALWRATVARFRRYGGKRS